MVQALRTVAKRALRQEAAIKISFGMSRVELSPEVPTVLSPQKNKISE